MRATQLSFGVSGEPAAQVTTEIREAWNYRDSGRKKEGVRRPAELLRYSTVAARRVTVQHGVMVNVR